MVKKEVLSVKSLFWLNFNPLKNNSNILCIPDLYGLPKFLHGGPRHGYREGLLHGRQQGLARPHGCEHRRGSGLEPGGGEGHGYFHGCTTDG